MDSYHHNLEEVVPLGHPTIRVWEINDNTTRYEKLQAAPSDDDLFIMWILWVVISGGIAIFIGSVLTAMLLNRKVRSNPFNLFLIYLMIPDLLFSGFCGLTCLLNAIAGEYWSVSMCQFQSFYLTFGVAANNWLNLFVALELYTMLKSSRVFMKYQLPSTRKVTTLALGVYCYSCFVASWALWGSRFDNFPHETVSISGLGCFPLEFSRASSFFYFLVYIPMVAMIPLVIVVALGVIIWYKDLMPPPGKRRMLGTFFARIMAAYVIMWMPYLVMCLAGSGRPWLVFAGGSWGHFQGVVSSVIALTKPDLRHAYKRLITCKTRTKDPAELPKKKRPSSRTSRWSNLSNSTRKGKFLQRFSKFSIDDYLPEQNSDFNFTDEKKSLEFPKERSKQKEKACDSPVQESRGNIESNDLESPNEFEAHEISDSAEIDDYLPEQGNDFAYKDEQVER